MFSPALVHIAKWLACAPVIVLALAVADSFPAAPLKKPELDSLARPSRRGHLPTSLRSFRPPENECGPGGQRCCL